MFRPVHAAELILRATGPQTGSTLRISHLAHLCDGWHRAVHGVPLIDGRLVAEDTGPAYLEILETIRDPRLGFDPRSAGPGFTPAQADLVTRVVAKHASSTTDALRTALTTAGTPWHRTYFSPSGRGATIDGDLVRYHFLALARAGRSNPSIRVPALLA